MAGVVRRGGHLGNHQCVVMSSLHIRVCVPPAIDKLMLTGALFPACHRQPLFLANGMCNSWLIATTQHCSTTV
jgi:hypothetical protein